MRPAAGPRPVSYYKRDPSPSTMRYTQDSGAGVPPYNRRREKKRKSTRDNFIPPHTLPALSAFPTLSTHPSLRHEQLLHPFRPPSSFQLLTAQGNGQTAFPTWDWLTAPGHLPGSSPPTPPASPPPAWGFGSVVGRATESF